MAGRAIIDANLLLGFLIGVAVGAVGIALTILGVHLTKDQTDRTDKRGS
jgi:hypothetical protein